MTKGVEKADTSARTDPRGSPRSVSGTRTRSAADPAVGDLVEGFEITSVLSADRTCVLAAHREHAKSLVVLRVPSALALDEGSALIDNEARLIGVTHPNLVRVLERGEWRGAPFVVREHVSGLALATVLDALARRDRRLEPELAVMIGLRLARALGALHSAAGVERRGFLHGDLHPGNVLISRRGQAKLIDLGSTVALPISGEARAAGHGPSAAASLMARSPDAGPRAPSARAAYAAPEQRGGVVDERADLFALAAVIAHLLSGHAPSEDADASEWAAEALVGEPDLLVNLLIASLDADPAARPPSARAFADALARSLPSASTWSEPDLVRSLRNAPRREPVAGLRPSAPPPPPPGGPRDPRTISTPPAGLNRNIQELGAAAATAPSATAPSATAPSATAPPVMPAATSRGSATRPGSRWTYEPELFDDAPPSSGASTIPPRGRRRPARPESAQPPQEAEALHTTSTGIPPEIDAPVPKAGGHVLELEPPPERREDATSRTLLAQALSDPGRSADDLAELEVEGVADAPVPLFRVIAILALAALLVLGGLAYALLR